MKTFRKLTAALLAAALALALLPSSAFAAAAGPLSVNTVVSPVYDDARSFSDGLAAVYNGSKWGYIDASGAVVIDFKWDSAGDFSEGHAVVALKSGSVESRFLIDRTGKTAADIGDFSSGTAANSVISSGTYISSGKMYSLRSDHSVLPMTSFSSALAYNEGFAVVSTDAAGSFVFPDSMKPYLPVLSKLGGDMLVDFAGNVVWNPDWGMCLSYDHGLVPVQSRSTGLWGFSDKTGAYVIQPQFEDLWYTYDRGVCRVFHDGLASAVKNGKCIVINLKGETVYTSGASSFGIYSEGLFPFEKNGLWGYADLKGNSPIAPAYVSAEPFSDGVALVSTGADYYYFIDRQGNRVNAIPYEKAWSFSDGLALICSGGKYGFISLGGRAFNTVHEKITAWAVPELDSAFDFGLLPNELACMYDAPVTRRDFAVAVTLLLESVSGKSIDQFVLAKTGKTLDSFVQSYPFSDTNDRNILAAYALGIVIGVGDGSFHPYDSIERCAAAKMLAISAQLSGIAASGAAVVFEDAASFQSWAPQYIDFVSALGIMKGTDSAKNIFSPKALYTREQAFATMQRIYKMAKGIE